LTFEVYVCANPGKFEVNFGAIYVQNPGKTLGSDVGMSHNPGKVLGPALGIFHGRHLGTQNSTLHDTTSSYTLLHSLAMADKQENAVNKQDQPVSRDFTVSSTLG
jgi:hypothetical protein